MLCTHAYTYGCDSQHDNTHTARLACVDVIVRIYSARQDWSSVVEEVVVQFTITWFELLLLEEQWVVEEGKGIEDVEVILFCENESIVDEEL